MAEFFFYRSLDEAIQGDAQRRGFPGRLPVQIRIDPDVEATLIGLLRRVPRHFAQFQIVVHGFMEGLAKLIDRLAFEHNEAVYPLDLSEETVVLFTKTHNGHVPPIIKGGFHGRIPTFMSSATIFLK